MLSTKIRTLLSDGIDPFIEGKRNLDNPTPEFEQLAKERATICMGCRYFKKEPIPFLWVIETRIPELSEMACGKCGCELSLKTRQNIKPCSKWLNKQ